MRSVVGVVAGLTALSLCGTAYGSGVDKGPYLMYPTQSGITVCWVSSTSSTGTVTLKEGGKTATDAAPTRYHRVKLTGLKPYTRYAYSVSCEGETKSGEFTTAAQPGQSFKFVAYGDNRTQPQKHAAVLASMSKFKPDFIVQTGDQVADGTNESQWDEFWQITSKELCNTAYYPSLGNHERNGSPYYKYFAVPQEYSFDYGDIHFVALDSNRSEAEYAKQNEWLRKDLLAHQGAKWRVVFFHHTVHTCVDKPGRREESIERAKRLEPIFAEGHVQLVINGHDHDYQRHVSKGITYLVTGGGGAPLYDVTPDTPYVKKAEKTHHHCELTVNGNTIGIRAVRPDGSVIEQLSISADKPAE